MCRYVRRRQFSKIIQFLNSFKPLLVLLVPLSSGVGVLCGEKLPAKFLRVKIYNKIKITNDINRLRYRQSTGTASAKKGFSILFLYKHIFSRLNQTENFPPANFSSGSPKLGGLGRQGILLVLLMCVLDAIKCIRRCKLPQTYSQPTMTI